MSLPAVRQVAQITSAASSSFSWIMKASRPASWPRYESRMRCTCETRKRRVRYAPAGTPPAVWLVD
eukprot:8717238-Pyramimonas_sp.AAC.1